MLFLLSPLTPTPPMKSATGYFSSILKTDCKHKSAELVTLLATSPHWPQIPKKMAQTCRYKKTVTFFCQLHLWLWMGNPYVIILQGK